MRKIKKEALSERIFRAAVEEIAEKGFYRAKIRSIAGKAKTSDSGFYNIFKSKEDLLAEIVRRAWAEILRRVKKELVGINDPIEMMELLFKVTAEYLLKEEPDIGTIMLIDGRKEWGVEEKLITQEQLDFFEIIEKIIMEAQKKGIYRNDYRIEAARQALFGAGEDLLLGIYLKGNSNYKANYTIEEAARICVLMQRTLFSTEKILEEIKKDPEIVKELIEKIAGDRELFRIIENRKEEIEKRS